MKTEIRCQNAIWADEIQLAVLTTDHDGRRFIGEPPALRELKPGALIGTPTLSMHHTEAQQLIDELWRCGLRPTEGKGSAGSLKATENHLADMRRIAFTVLEIKDQS